ncbi:MAG: hypothetical protein IT379_30035 [Deltaproteobacteria bacterium]|nr:hypothetical protein [Deltaproteobacteria bacterium]
MTASTLYVLGAGAPEGASCDDPALVGGKAASLAVMASLGLAVPPGIVAPVPTARVLAASGDEPDGALDRFVDRALAWIERASGKKLGPGAEGLSLAVRGGAAQSMPGALPTVLDVVERTALRSAVLRVACAHPDTAVIVQAMVSGTEGDGGAGIALSRDPQTGEKRIAGEWIAHARGRDVADGKTVPSPIARSRDSLEVQAPDVFAELVSACAAIEARLRDVVEIELTVERGKLWLLQARPAAVSPRAQVRIAVDLVREGSIDRATAIGRVPVEALDALVRPVALAPAALAAVGVTPIGTGLPASAGTATGVVVVDPERVLARAANGEAVILVRRDASTEDVAGMRAAVGILTSSGGLTSHAAVVARALRKPCVTAATDVIVDYAGRRMIGNPSAPQRSEDVRVSQGGPGGRDVPPARNPRSGSQPPAVVREPVVVAEGETITVDGSRGHVYAGVVPTEPQFELVELETLLGWADDLRRASVLAEAGSVIDVAAAIGARADGVTVATAANAGEVERAASELGMRVVPAADAVRVSDVAEITRALSDGASAVCCIPALVPAARLVAARATLARDAPR